ncbi:MAG: hypothetical protein AMJ43_04410 [Coxiella sp. DG_40]|nr:MAG: hypothetical protein AMJ43_04410 [Coxiella sp. DG_40]
MKLKTFLVLFVILFPVSIFSSTTYIIDAVTNDDKVVIDGNVYEAETILPISVNAGDEVIFVNGYKDACATIEIVDLTANESFMAFCD